MHGQQQPLAHIQELHAHNPINTPDILHTNHKYRERLHSKMHIYALLHWYENRFVNAGHE